MKNRSAEDMAAALSLLLHQKLGVRGGGLEAKVTRAGRLLPARIRREAMLIVEAENRAAHPKLARQTDQDALVRAFAEVERHLNGIDATDRRKGALISFFGGLSFNLLAAGALLLAFLVWQGLL